jgi:hypothetical protein
MTRRAGQAAACTTKAQAPNVSHNHHLHHPGCTLCPRLLKKMDELIPGQYDVVSLADDATAKALVVDQLGHLQAPVTIVTDEDGSIVDHWGRISIDRLREYQLQLVGNGLETGVPTSTR